MQKTSGLQKLLIKDETHSINIEFNNETKVLEMKGHTLPPNAKTFFIPIVTWAEEFLKTKPSETTINIAFKYLHSAAGKQVFELIRLLKHSEANGNSITVNWYYEDDDDDMEQLGVDFSSVLGMKFNYTTFES